ncbi:MAG: hypothetical protein M1300_10840 [Epsilonproteobacteria bacterium]|nr:hypothetical protein [Campylobacterota bacterium]
MIISVLNKKGGVGKTPIAFSLAKDLDLNLQSNDNSVIGAMYEKAKIVDKIVLEQDTVYDFGGFVDSGVIDVIKHSDVVVVPCSVDYNSIIRTIETLEEIQGYNKPTVIIITKTEKESDFLWVMDQIREFFSDNDLMYFELRNSKIFKNSMETGASVSELYHQTPLSKSVYNTVFQQYNSVLGLFKTS